MLTSIVATDADEAGAHAHHSPPGYSFITVEVRCSTKSGARVATLCITPAVARQLLDAIDVALEDLDSIRARLAEQRAAVSRDTDNEASETEASHVDP